MLLGGTGTWHQHLGAFQTAWHFTTHGQPIGKTGRKNRERKATQGIGVIYVNKSIPVPHRLLEKSLPRAVRFCSAEPTLFTERGKTVSTPI